MGERTYCQYSEDYQVPPCKWWWQQISCQSTIGKLCPWGMYPPPSHQPCHCPLLRPGSLSALSRSDLCLHEDQDEDQEGRNSGCHHHPGRERTGTAQGWDEPCTLMGGGHREPRGHGQLLQGQKEDRVQGHCHPMLGTHAAAAPTKLYVPSTRTPGNLSVNRFGGN